MNLIGQLLFNKKQKTTIYLIIDRKIRKITCVDPSGQVYNTTIDYMIQFYDIKNL